MPVKADLGTMRTAHGYNFWCKLAAQEILESYGEQIIIKPKSLHKFGRTTDADANTQRTVWLGTEVNETYVTTNAIDTVSSSDAGDDQVLAIEGHTVSGTGADQEFTFVTQTATLNGQTKVTLGTPLARVSRLVNDGIGSWDGTIYVYEDGAITAGVPDDATTIHLTVLAADQQSEKAAITLSNVDYGLMTGWYAGANRNASANVDLQLQVRKPGGPFRPQSEMNVRTGAGPFNAYQFRPFLIVPRNYDVRVVCTSSANNTTVTAGFSAMFGLNEAGVALRAGT